MHRQYDVFAFRIGPPADHHVAVLFNDVSASVRAQREAERLQHIAEAAERRLAFLAEASARLAGSLDVEATLRTIAELAVPALADWCFLEVLEAGVVRQAAVAHVQPEMVRFARELLARFPIDLNASFGTGKVLRTGEPELVADITDETLVGVAQDEHHLALLRSTGLRSSISVPLLDETGRAMAVLSLVSADSGRRFGESDVAMAMEVARRAGAALANARLFEAERAARAEAEPASRAKSQFLANMSHELRTPLNAIAGHVQLLEMGIHGPVTDAQRDALDRIERAQRHLLGLINDVLNFARIEAGRVEYDLAPVLRARRARRRAADGRAAGRREVADAGASHPRTSAPSRSHVWADREKLGQILLNLLSNAVKFTPEGGRIDASPSRRDGPDHATRAHRATRASASRPTSWTRCSSRSCRCTPTSRAARGHGARPRDQPRSGARHGRRPPRDERARRRLDVRARAAPRLDRRRRAGGAPVEPRAATEGERRSGEDREVGGGLLVRWCEWFAGEPANHVDHSRQSTTPLTRSTRRSTTPPFHDVP